jgi:hypothetical protein
LYHFLSESSSGLASLHLDRRYEDWSIRTSTRTQASIEAIAILQLIFISKAGSLFIDTAADYRD